MVSAYLADVLRDPTAGLNDLYTKSSASSGFPCEVAHHFSMVFSSDDAFTEVNAPLHSEQPPLRLRRVLVYEVYEANGCVRSRRGRLGPEVPTIHVVVCRLCFST